MNKLFQSWIVRGLALLLAATAAFAQDRVPFRQAELDQMLAPVALYPDPLLTQVLMAATYPLEVVQAARWSRANPNLKGQDAVRAVETMDWDPSVKSLVAFPQILHRMDEQLDWTQRLGEAFLAQEPHVMDAIQGLRQRAERAGNLRSNEQTRVTRQDEHILVEPAQQQVVYVPYYDPNVVYGSWWWPGYPPYYWGPPPGYYAWPAYAPGFYWGPAIAFSWGFFFGHADWHHHHVKVVHAHPHHPHGAPVAKPVKWQHNPVHRRNVPYRHVDWRPPSGQHPAMRGDDRLRPVARNEPRGSQPETRSAAPQSRPQLRPQSVAPQPRSEHSAPQVSGPLSDRTAPQMRDRPSGQMLRAESQRPQTRAPEQRPSITQRTDPLPRPVAPPHVVRAEPRAHPPVAHAPAAPRRESAPSHRAELRVPIREHFMVPGAAASAPMQAPRATGNPAGGARAYGGGHRPAMSASRGSGRS